MKTIVVIVILGALVLGGVYLFGGYQSFDPNKQGKDARAAITPGMTLQQVLSVAGENPKYQSISIHRKKIGKEIVEDEQVGPPVDFDRAKVEGRIKGGQVPNGFMLQYVFSNSEAFAVRFDPAGKVTEIENVATLADLLQTRQK